MPMSDDIRYALSRWAGLARFLDDGRVEIDSNVVERGSNRSCPLRSRGGDHAGTFARAALARGAGFFSDATAALRPSPIDLASAERASA